MRRELLQHKLAYTILIIGLISLTLMFLAAWPEVIYQRLVILCLVVFYIVWGIASHLHESHITKKLVSEYVTIGVLAGVILFLVTL